MVTTNVVIINKLRGSNGSFAIAMTIMAIGALFLGYIVYNKTGRKHKQHRAMAAQMSRSVMSYDVHPTQLKARIVSILTNNTMDLNILNNVMNHVLNKIDADLQNGGLLNGLIVERSIGSIDRNKFSARLAEYIKNLAHSLQVPLMNRDHGVGSFVRRYMEAGGGSGGVGYGTLYGRAKSQYKERAPVYGMPARVTADKRIELLDQTLRSY